MIRIPNKDKKYIVDNASFSRGNIYSTWNTMLDKDIGKISLNPKIDTVYSYLDSADFRTPRAIVVAPKDGGGGLDTYILTSISGQTTFVWSTYGGLVKLTGTNVPTSSSAVDMILSWSQLFVSDDDGLHYIMADDSADGAWTLKNAATFKNRTILVYFQEQDRIYFFNATSVISANLTLIAANTPTTSGAYTITAGLSAISCARAASKRIWFAESGVNGSQISKIYEWDGVQTNPLNIFTIETGTIQSIVILNDQPIVIDGRGRLWFYDGYTFILKSGMNIPAREDDFAQTCLIGKNASFADKGKAYFLVGPNPLDNPNTSERALAGIWCYDPVVGIYHYSSPDNNTGRFGSYVLAKGTTDQAFACGFYAGTFSGNGATATQGNRYAKTTTSGGLGGGIRKGHVITQFMESQNLTDMWNSIAVKYRKMIDPDAVLEVKYRTWKNVEFRKAEITWTAATTFTVSTANITGAGSTYNTPVAVGDEVMVNSGTNVGLVAHVVTMVDNAGTTTVTIDRSATTTTGTSEATFSNFTLLGTITADGETFKNYRLAKKSTMIQVKLVMSWKGYYDEVQEILLSEQAQDKTI